MPTETRGFQSTRKTTINKSRCSCMVSFNLSLIRSTPGNVKILISLSFYAEIGHNFNLGHSGGLDGLEYTDHTGLMGNPWYADDVGAICFNAAKSWQLGWYDSSTIVINPRDNPSWTGTIVGNSPQSLRTMVSCIHAGHTCQQSLRRTDVGSSPFPFNVLLPGLEGHPECWLLIYIN
jgi:hypothetical protein